MIVLVSAYYHTAYYCTGRTACTARDSMTFMVYYYCSRNTMGFRDYRCYMQYDVYGVVLLYLVDLLVRQRQYDLWLRPAAFCEAVIKVIANNAVTVTIAKNIVDVFFICSLFISIPELRIIIDFYYANFRIN